MLKRGSSQLRHRKKPAWSPASTWQQDNQALVREEGPFNGMRVPTQLSSEQFQQLYVRGLEVASNYRMPHNGEGFVWTQSPKSPYVFIMDDFGLYYHFIKDPIGKGKFGAVYVGVNLKEAKICALKKIRRIKTSEPGADTQYEGILKEEGILDKLGRLQGVANDESHYYIIQDYAYGNTLKAYRYDQGFKPLTFLEKIEFAISLVDELRNFHRRDITHRDFKLDNIIYDKANQKFTLCDFGFSDDKDAPVKKIDGTPLYMPPEYFNHEYTQTSDVYSLGVVLSMMFTTRDLNELMKELYRCLPPEPTANEKVESQLEYYSKVHVLFKALIPEFDHASKTLEIDTGTAKYAEYSLWKLLLSTLNTKPSQRPTLDVLKSHLCQMVKLISEQEEPSLESLLENLNALSIEQIQPLPKIQDRVAPPVFTPNYSGIYLVGLTKDDLDSSFMDLIPDDDRCCPCNIL